MVQAVRPNYSMRFVRMLVVGVIAWAIYSALQPYGYGWLMLPVAAFLLIGSSLWMIRRRRSSMTARATRWMEASLSEQKRPGAIAEIREEVKKLEPVSALTQTNHARLSILLSELLSAHGEAEEARAVVDELDTEKLNVEDRAAVVHGRALVRLRAGDAEGAKRCLKDKPVALQDSTLAMRIELLEAAADAELGDEDRALEAAMDVRRRAGGAEDLIVEARVIRASALDAKGERDEALEVIRSLGDGMLHILSALGLPRAKSLAEQIRAERT